MRGFIFLASVMICSANLDICKSTDEKSNGHTFVRMAQDCGDLLWSDGRYDPDIPNAEKTYALNGCPYWDPRNPKSLKRRCAALKISRDASVAKWFYLEESNVYRLAGEACGLTEKEAKAVIADASGMYGSLGYNGRPFERHRQAAAIDHQAGEYIDLPEIPGMAAPREEPGDFEFRGYTLNVVEIKHDAADHDIKGKISNATSDPRYYSDGGYGDPQYAGTWQHIVNEDGFQRAARHVSQPKTVDEMPPAFPMAPHETRAQQYQAMNGPYAAIHAPDEAPVPRIAPLEVQETWEPEEREAIARLLQQFRCALTKALEMGFDKAFYQIERIDGIDDLRKQMASECFWDVVDDFCGNQIALFNFEIQTPSARVYFGELVTDFYNNMHAKERIEQLNFPLYQPLITQKTEAIAKVVDKHYLKRDGSRKENLTEKEDAKFQEDLAKMEKKEKAKMFPPKFNGVVEDARDTGCGEVGDTVKMPDACVREHVIRAVVPPYFGYPYASTQDGSSWTPSSQYASGGKDVLNTPFSWAGQKQGFFNRTGKRWTENREKYWPDDAQGFPGPSIEDADAVISSINAMVANCQKSYQGQICWQFTALLRKVGWQKRDQLLQRCKDIRGGKLRMKRSSACDNILGGLVPGESFTAPPSTDVDKCDELFGEGAWYTDETIYVGIWQIARGIVMRIEYDPGTKKRSIRLVIGPPDAKRKVKVKEDRVGACLGEEKEIEKSGRTIRFTMRCTWHDDDNKFKVETPVEFTLRGPNMGIKTPFLNEGKPVEGITRNLVGRVNIDLFPPPAYQIAVDVIQEIKTNPFQQQSNDGCRKPDHSCRRPGGHVDPATCKCVCDKGYYGKFCEMRDTCGFVYYWKEGKEGNSTLPTGQTIGPVEKTKLTKAMIEASLFTGADGSGIPPSRPWLAMLKRLIHRPLQDEIDELKDMVMNPEKTEDEGVDNLQKGFDKGHGQLGEILKLLKDAKGDVGKVEKLKELVTRAEKDKEELPDTDPDGKDPCSVEMQIAIRNEVRRWRRTTGMDPNIAGAYIKEVAGKRHKLRPLQEMDGEVSEEEVDILPLHLKVYASHIAMVQCMMRLVQDLIPADAEKDDTPLLQPPMAAVSLGQGVSLPDGLMYPIKLPKVGSARVVVGASSALEFDSVITNMSALELDSEEQMVLDRHLRTGDSFEPFEVPIRPHCEGGDCERDGSGDVLKVKPKAYRNRIRPTEATRWRQERVTSVLQQSSEESQVESTEESVEVEGPAWPDDDTPEQPLVDPKRKWDCEFASFRNAYLTCGDRVQMTEAAMAKLGRDLALQAYGASVTGRNGKSEICLTMLKERYYWNNDVDPELQRKEYRGCFPPEDLERFKPKKPAHFKYTEAYAKVCKCSKENPAPGEKVCALRSKSVLHEMGFYVGELDATQACHSEKTPDFVRQSLLSKEDCEFYVPAIQRKEKAGRWEEHETCPSQFSGDNGWEWIYGDKRNRINGKQVPGFLWNRCLGISMWSPSYESSDIGDPPEWVEEKWKGRWGIEWEEVIETPALPDEVKWLQTLKTESDVAWGEKFTCEQMRAMQWAFHRTDMKNKGDLDPDRRPRSESPPGLDPKLVKDYVCHQSSNQVENKKKCDQEFQNVMMLFRRTSETNAVQEYFSASMSSFTSVSTQQAAFAFLNGGSLSGGKMMVGQDNGSNSVSMGLKRSFSHLCNLLHLSLYDMLSRGLVFGISWVSGRIGDGFSLLGRGLKFSGKKFYTSLWQPYIMPRLRQLGGAIAKCASAFYRVCIKGWSYEKPKESKAWAAERIRLSSETEEYAKFVASLAATKTCLADFFSAIGGKSAAESTSQEGTSTLAIGRFFAPAVAAIGYGLHAVFVRFLCRTLVSTWIPAAGLFLGKGLFLLLKWGLYKPIMSFLSATGRLLKGIARACYSFWVEFVAIACIWKASGLEEQWPKIVESANDFSNYMGDVSTQCGVKRRESVARVKAACAQSFQDRKQECADLWTAIKPHLEESARQTGAALSTIGKYIWWGSASTWNGISTSTSAGLLTSGHAVFGTSAWFIFRVLDVSFNTVVRSFGWSLSQVGKSFQASGNLLSTRSNTIGNVEFFANFPGTDHVMWVTIDKFWPSGWYEGVRIPEPKWD